MIQILTGVPGSGKTYFAVHEILEHLENGCLVVHNIHGFSDSRALSIDFGAIPLDADSLFAYFDQLRVTRALPPETLIYVYIDEAQRYYPYEFKDPRGVYFFDFHRHHGLHITLISQDIKKLSPKITTLAEFEVRAVKPIFQLTPGFSYNLLSSGEAFGKRRLPKKQEVFATYTSFTSGTKHSKKSKLIYAVPISIFVAISAYVVFQYSFASSFDKLSEAHNQAKADKTEKYKAEIMPTDAMLSSVVSPDLTSKNKTAYLGPVVLDYSSSRDAVKIKESDFDVWLNVKEFISRFEPILYGYGYVHLPGKRFIQMNSANNEYLFPVQNSVYIRQYIKSSDDLTRAKPAENASIQYPLHFENMSPGPDKHGYTRKDYELIYRRQRGLSDPSPVLPATAAPPTNSTS